MLEHILQAFFPDQCIGCGTWGAVLCQRCAYACPRYVAGVHEVRAERVAVQFAYEGHIRQLILRLKYAGQRRIATQLAQYMPAMFPTQPACYVAVPASPARVAQRGYDQAVLLAQALARRHNGYVVTRLVRTRDTPTQAKLDRHQRLQNVAHAFAWHGVGVKDPIVLVDDVCTTGATLNAAIQVLQSAGMHHIVVQVVARGVIT